MNRWILLSLVLAGCDRIAGLVTAEQDDDHGDEHGEEHAEEAAHGENAEGEGEGQPGAPSVLHVTDDLRRDLRVSTATATAKAGDERVTVLGEVRVHEDALASVAAPVSARVVRVLAQSGAAIAAGEALVELESVEVGRARTDLLSARAGAIRADAALARKQGLGEVASTAEVELAVAEAAAATAELRAAEAALAALGVGVKLPDPVDGRFTLRAPTGGVVLSREATRGAVVDAEEVLFRVGDLGRLLVEVHAFERDAVRVKAGDHADIDLSALPGEVFSGTVARIGGEVSVESRTVPVWLEVANDGRLRPGMAATARLGVSASNGEIVAVPAAALQRLEGGWVVFVPASPDEYQVRPVGRGRDLGSEAEILTGLAAGDTVVVEGAFLLKAEAEKRAGGGEGDHDH